jgi:hypothetical protein
MGFTLGLALLLQQAPFLGHASPPSGDTTGYWQQRASYTIVATLDESRNVLRATAELVYVNNSPDTLRELYVHQYLNAFRPGSKWSAADEREGRTRFQALQEPDYGYETFTRAPIVDGTPVLVEYPGAPDSTVARIRVPRPILPGATTRVSFEWEARPSTLPRRQGRRGRTFDFAHWYPRVAVYDRGGWQPNALVPAGEFYSEFGDFDVTLIVRDDQVVGATGVPVSGDPGYERVRRDGDLRLAAGAYATIPPAPEARVPAGSRAIRWIARDVHTFAWSASPDYRYEGGIHVRQVSPRRYAIWDTVSIHVLMKPGDEATWGNGIAVRRTADALRWLEQMYGPYPYPQVTNLHRLDGGGTEFPMMMMNGSPSYGLILHELGHIYTYGILANNEWRSGFLDEGFTDYQTRWAQGLTAIDRARQGVVAEPPRLAPGYRANAVTIPRGDSTDLPQHRLAIIGRAQPIGTNSADFSEFSIYNSMIYDRASAMYAHLRDILGDSGYMRMTRDLYERWAFRHFDERALRASAERAHGASLAWFFDQWVHDDGLLDYGVGSVSIEPAVGGGWVTRAEIIRRGDYRHPMPVGVFTGGSWRIARARPELDRQILEMTTEIRPDSVRIDPHAITWDWDRRNNAPSSFLLSVREPRLVPDWPFLDQSDREHTIVALMPRLWLSRPQGLAVGVGARTNYLGLVDRHDGGVAVALDRPDAPPGRRTGPASQLQFWARAWDLYVPGIPRPLMGWRGEVNWLDGIARLGASRRWDLSPFIVANGPRIEATAALTGTYPTETLLLPEQWSNMHVTELSGAARARSARRADSTSWSATLDAGIGNGTGRDSVEGTGLYGRLLGTVTSVYHLTPGSQVATVRVAGGWAPGAPLQRAIFASTRDPFETFTNDYFRPRGALFKRDWVNVLPLGGLGLRGFTPLLAADAAIAANGELAQRLVQRSGAYGRLGLWVQAFGDLGVIRYAREGVVTRAGDLLLDAGAGVSLRGRFYDRDINLRLDLPVFVNHSALDVGRSVGGASLALRWVVGF